jgi:membrane-associated phospholipid phosphatase
MQTPALWLLGIDATFYPVVILLFALHWMRLLVGAIILLAVVKGLKDRISKERPDKTDRRSFPSGHSAFAWFLAIAYQNNPLWMVWAFFVSWSRVALHRHDIMDVVVGGILGACVAKVFS